jgi:TolB-like protein/Tfp pilus assembly protein PilF
VNPKNFFAELKRRNVYKVAVAYAVVAWLLIQAASIFFPAFDAPLWVMRVFIVVIILGFPIALVLSWAFEITSEGIKLESGVAPNRSITRRTGRKIVGITVVVAVLAAGLMVFQLVRREPVSQVNEPRAPGTIPEKSIAVLPFQNLSRDPDNAYFADGIQDEILTRLAKIAELKVIARTSTQKYKSAPDNLQEAGKQLGVANILEGSVQRSGDLVHVNVQLIRADTDAHLWAESYDCKLSEGIFVVEAEVAQKVASALHAKLTGAEEEALVVKPTNNPEAYDAYLRGLAFEVRSAPFASLEAAGSYERAVQLDPNFAIAWARLSRMDSAIYLDRYNASTAARGEAAKRALENAQKLDPNSPETLLALGYYQYWVLTDYGAAKTTFGRVSKLLPGSSEVPRALGYVTRREGNWDQSIAYFEQALVLDPRNVVLLTDAAFTYTMLRQFAAVLRFYDRVLDINPNDPDAMAAKAGIYQAQGKLQEAAGFVSQIDWRTPSEKAFGIKIDQLRLERDYAEAIRLLQARLAQFHFGSEFDKAGNQLVLSFAQRLQGDTAGAKAAAEQARHTLEQFYRDQPDSDSIAAAVSLAYAALGEKDSALKAAERATVLLPSAKDRLYGPGHEEILAFVQTIVGENSRAISILTQLLQTPYFGRIYSEAPITPALLRLDPIWDPLRADPAFQKLCEEKQP